MRRPSLALLLLVPLAVAGIPLAAAATVPAAVPASPPAAAVPTAPAATRLPASPVPSSPPPSPAPTRPPSTGAPLGRVVFTAAHRSSRGQVDGPAEIYVANGDGSNVTAVTSNAFEYNFSSWAFNGNKIVYARRPLKPGTHYQIGMINPDGSGDRVLITTDWDNSQPKVSPDGKFLYFSSKWPELPSVALYRMDLATLEVQGVSTGSDVIAGYDADPKLCSDGTRLAFSSFPDANQTKTRAQISVMSVDGSGRTALTADDYDNVDPAFDPVRCRYITYASYRGGGDSHEAGNGEVAKLYGWRLMLLDTQTGAKTFLTQGLGCAFNQPLRCTPAQGSAYTPQWSPDGRSIGFVSIMAPDRAGIYIIDPDGGNARPLVEFANLAVDWFDWHIQGPPPAGAIERIGSQVSPERLVFVGESAGASPAQAKRQIYVSTRDRWLTVPVSPDRAGLQPDFARLSADRKQIVFSAGVDFDSTKPLPAPAPPPGRSRQAHFILSDLDLVAVAEGAPPALDTAREQLFMMNLDGSGTRQLTTPWTEDYLDGLRDGDARGNFDPDLSPDGRYLVFTNVSTLTAESFILRLDLKTGEVVNLTSVTAGAAPASDSRPRYSPDGSLIAFVSVVNGLQHVYEMTFDGHNVRELSSGNVLDTSPSWSPDGRWIAFASYRGPGDIATGSSGVPLDSWALAKVNVETSEEILLSRVGQYAVLGPQWDPSGDRIGFIGTGPQNQADIEVVGPDGSRPTPLKVTLKTKEIAFDWR